MSNTEICEYFSANSFDSLNALALSLASDDTQVAQEVEVDEVFVFSLNNQVTVDLLHALQRVQLSGLNGRQVLIAVPKHRINGNLTCQKLTNRISLQHETIKRAKLRKTIEIKRGVELNTSRFGFQLTRANLEAKCFLFGDLSLSLVT